MASLEFGCLCLPIQEQLDKLDVVCDPKRIADFQKDVDAINHLKMRHLIPKSQLDKAYDKLAKRVFGHIRKPKADLYTCPKCGYVMEIEDDECEIGELYRCPECMEAYLEILV